MLKKLAEFFLLLTIAIWGTYYGPAVVKAPVYILLLVAYYRSEKEGMWLALFLTITDGFWGFFNPYEAVVSLIPGMPPIEIGHLYILTTIAKAIRKPDPGKFFHHRFLKVLAIYIGFLIVQGYVIGLSMEMNIQFRMIKFLFPLGLFYSLPRLFQSDDEFKECWVYIFPMAFLALFAQVYTITTGHTPSQTLGVYKKFWFTVDVSKGKTYRGFYSSNSLLMAYLGAFYYLARKDKQYFHYLYLFSVIAAGLLCVILSATRGWLIGFGLGFVLFVLFVMKMKARQVATVSLSGVAIVMALLMIPVVGKQFTNAFIRFTTLEKLAGGDVTAGGTLERLNVRSPRVMDKWSETPLTGWGFSDTFFHYADFHVANQNILLHSGIIGAFLMGMFFLFFHSTLLARSLTLGRGHPMKRALLVFVIFFPGWYFIHSTSGQHFAFYQEPVGGITNALYFTLGAFTYQRSFKARKRAPLPVTPPAEGAAEKQVPVTA